MALAPSIPRPGHRLRLLQGGGEYFGALVEAIDAALRDGPLPSPRFDFAVRVEGPLVANAEAAMSRLWLRIEAMRDMRHARLGGALDSLRASGVGMGKQKVTAPASDEHGSRAALVLRDNL